VDASFGIGIALDANSLTRSFAGAGIGGGALATHRQPAQVTDAAVTLDALKAFEVHADFPAEIAFDDVLAVLNGMHDLGQLLFVKVLGADAGVNFGFFQNHLRVAVANAVNVTERNVDALFPGNFNSNDTCHKILSLSLFVALIRANDTNDAFAFDDFAMLAKFFDRCANFHT
jgi:hypothetical protein